MKRIFPMAALMSWPVAPAAFAHAVLLSATPPAGSRAAIPPIAVTLVFSEALEPQFSSVTVTDEAGIRVDRGGGARQQQGHSNKVLKIGLPALKAGQYNVAWRAISVDTHKSQGSYVFNISP